MRDKCRDCEWYDMDYGCIASNEECDIIEEAIERQDTMKTELNRPTTGNTDSTINY